VLACYILQIASRLAMCKSQLPDGLPVGHIHSCLRDEDARKSFRRLRGHTAILGLDCETPEAMLVVKARFLLEWRLTFSKTHECSAARLRSRIVLATNVRMFGQPEITLPASNLCWAPRVCGYFPPLSASR
jgi:hypothetical protein